MATAITGRPPEGRLARRTREGSRRRASVCPRFGARSRGVARQRLNPRRRRRRRSARVPTCRAGRACAPECESRSRNRTGSCPAPRDASRKRATRASSCVASRSDSSNSWSNRRVIVANMPTPSSVRMTKNVPTYHAVSRSRSRPSELGTTTAGRAPLARTLIRPVGSPRRAACESA